MRSDGFGCVKRALRDQPWMALPVVSVQRFKARPFGSSVGIGGAQKSQDYNKLPEGVYRQVPLHGILYWNSHAFNLTDEDHMMNGRLNYRFATDVRYQARGANCPQDVPQSSP